jgi:glycosyltransferase involved in cell wall biosynthesis
MTKPPLISVIIPVYNVAGHVVACLNSLRAQTYDHFEAIIIDDGSTDDSAARARAAVHDDPRFQIISQENRGLSAARNAGLDRAQGQFIAFLDSDDRLMADYLARLSEALQSSGCDWVACAVRSCFGDGSGATHSAIHTAPDLAAHPVPRRYEFAQWSDVICHFPSAWNKLYRRDLIEGLRFDEGTWFEDHSFFYRAADRTDHLLHLPEPLYLQTRDRPGQITASDDDRVFEQFDVLDQIRQIMQRSGRSGRSGAEDAFGQITSRLLFERSCALSDPERRARFARAAAQFLTDRGLRYDPDWDPGLALSWGMEMQGDLPLSVVLPWDGRDPALLQDSLRALATGGGPGYEALIICDHETTARAARQAIAPACAARILVQRGRGAAAARNHGLAQAGGACVLFLNAGDQLRPGALMAWTEGLLRHGADMGVTGFQTGAGDAATDTTEGHNGFHDMRLLPDGTPPSGPLNMTPMLALCLDPQPSAKIFRRDFLHQNGLKFTTGNRSGGDRSGWALCLAAALRGGQVFYLDGIGVDIAATRPPSSVSARALLGGHDRMIRALSATLPAPVLSSLPPGWQRRLFARALWQEWHFGPHRSRGARFRMLAFAALGAARRGYGQGITAAGLDPFTGPRLVRLFHLPTALRDTLKTLIGRPVTPPPPPKPPALYTFPLGQSGRVNLRADLRHSAYANLSFYTADRATIPFHLSLRRDEGLVVCNDRQAGGHWGLEHHIPHPLRAEIVEVTLVLTPPAIRVLLDGQEVFQLSDKRRRRFANLHDITGFELQGAFTITEMMPAAPGTELALDPRFDLRATLPPALHPDPDLHLRVAPDGPPLPLIPEAGGRDGQNRVKALLPGWIWAGLPAGADLELSLSGSELSQSLTLSRAGMLERLEAALHRQPDPIDSAYCLTVLEHLIQGRFFGPLAPENKACAIALADRFGLKADLLASDLQTCDPEAASPAPPSTSHETTEIDTALARFTQACNQSPSSDPLVVLRDLALPRPARHGLFLALSEVFSRDGQDFDSFSALARAEGFTALPVSDDLWTKSAQLPFLMLENRIDELRAALRDLRPPSKKWILTSPVAWVARRALRGRHLPSEAREDILRAFMEFVTHRAPEYWQRAPCHDLTIAAADLILAGDLLPYYLQDDCAHFCLRAYGLSRRFWNILAAGAGPDTPLPPVLAEARTAFDRIEAAAAGTDTDRAGLEQALRLFDAAGNPDTARFRRELLGPAGSGPPPGQPLEALRHMASPSSPPVADSVAKSVARHLPALFPLVPRTPNPELQRALARQIDACLRPGAPALTPEACARLLDELEQLSYAPAHFLGLGMGLILIAGLGERAGSAAMAQQIADWLLGHIAALPRDRQSALIQAPAIRQALMQLRASPAPLAAPLLAKFAPDAAPLPEAKQPDNAGLKPAHPLYDTLVCVFSCQAYLDTRIPALRRGWLSLLEDLGIPYVIIVGGGTGGDHGTRDGDILSLDAPDDYEGLPQKTLATIRWVHEQTGYGHMLKIDDDCFLNAPLFFQSLNYRKFDYYGRRLTRNVGDMDRRWHQKKSTTPRGQQGLDKSPEPSSYADGGSAYTLSRTAMRAALDAADSAAGQTLIQLSFMEDKMLGDLLALRGIEPHDEGYHVSIRRRTHSEAIPVASWHNSFFASPTAPVQMVHLDTHLDQDMALKRLSTPGLWPKKIWPGFQQVQLGYDSNALELISSEASTIAAREAGVAVVACLRNEMFMLPHFLAHYRTLGVEAFLIADNCSDDGTLEYLAEQPDVTLFSVDTSYNRSAYGVAWQQAMLAAFRVGKWSLVADADELLVWQENQRETLPDLLASPDFEGAEAARIFMLDMYPEGPLEEADFSVGTPFDQAGFADRVPFLTNTPMRGPYSDQPAWTSALRHRLLPGSRPNLFVAQKLALLRYQPFMRLSAGLHFVGDARLARRELIFAHFKYNSDFRRKAQTEVARGQHFNDAEEYRKYLALASEGRSIIFEPGISAPWAEVPFVAKRLS